MPRHPRPPAGCRSQPCSCGRPLGRGLACAPAEHAALEKRVAHHPVTPVRPPCNLAAGEEALQRGLTTGIDDEPAVLVVKDGIREERLAERVDAASTVAA